MISGVLAGLAGLILTARTTAALPQAGIAYELAAIAAVVIGGVEQKAHFFVMDLPHSDACFVRAYPAATAEAWVDGHVHAFAFFGKVPASVLYDNDRCLVAKILPDGTRKRATLFSGFLSHSLFRDRYGRPGKGNE